MRVLLIAVLTSLGFLAGCSQLKALHEPKSANSNSASTNSSASLPSGRGTPDEAKAMVEKAIEHYNQVGRAQALADFTKMKSPFGDRDLYVFCLGPDHKISANGGFAQYVGMSADVWKDADGKSLGKAIWDKAQETSDGSIEFRWVNPVSHVMENKIAFFKKVGQDVCGVGAYRGE